MVLQWWATETQRTSVARERHFELAQLAFEHPVLRGLGMAADSDEDALICRHANLWLSYWAWLWDLGDLDEAGLRRVAAHDLFIAPCGFRWWADAIDRGGWSAVKRNRHRLRRLERKHRKTTHGERPWTSAEDSGRWPFPAQRPAAAWYFSTTSRGIRPRSDRAIPLRLAQSRIA